MTFRLISVPSKHILLVCSITLIAILTACAHKSNSRLQPTTPVIVPANHAPTEPPTVIFPDMTAKVVQSLPHCTNLPPICAGGLLPQPVTGAQLEDYTAKYSVTGCRWTEPPRCALDKEHKPIRFCIEECTP